MRCAARSYPGCEAGSDCGKPGTQDAEHRAIRANLKPIIKPCTARNSRRSCGGGGKYPGQGRGTVDALCCADEKRVLDAIARRIDEVGARPAYRKRAFRFCGDAD